jgi:hypothetical protein
MFLNFIDYQDNRPADISQILNYSVRADYSEINNNADYCSIPFQIVILGS